MIDRIVPRPRYVEKILPLVDKPMVKVLTGVRRCGKSTILTLIRNHIVEHNPHAQIVELNLESAVGLQIETAEQLLDYVAEKVNTQQPVYFFFDEIQSVGNWQRAVNALRVDYTSDIYLTGSNATLLSGDLATHLAGRYVAFHIQPLSFAEFLELHKDRFPSAREAFDIYLIYGGYPELKFFDFAREQSLSYLTTVYDSTVLRDVIEYHHIRDVDVFHRIVDYCLRNVGTTFSARSMEKYFKNEGRTVSVDTILNYLSFCQQAFLIDKVSRTDAYGKKSLKANEKYYCVDHGLREVVGASNTADINLVLENIVYQELRSRGWNVQVGAVGAYEVDFVATRGLEKHYFQVAYVLADDKTVEREFRSLEEIRDNYPKTVLSMDVVDFSRGGILHRNIVDFLVDV